VGVGTTAGVGLAAAGGRQARTRAAAKMSVLRQADAAARHLAARADVNAVDGQHLGGRPRATSLS